MVVVGCLMCADCGVLFVACCFGVCGLRLCVVCWLLFDRWLLMLFVEFCLVFSVCCLLFMVCNVLLVVCCLLFIA